METPQRARPCTTTWWTSSFPSCDLSHLKLRSSSLFVWQLGLSWDQSAAYNWKGSYTWWENQLVSHGTFKDVDYRPTNWESSTCQCTIFERTRAMICFARLIYAWVLSLTIIWRRWKSRTILILSNVLHGSLGEFRWCFLEIGNWNITLTSSFYTSRPFIKTICRCGPWMKLSMLVYGLRYRWKHLCDMKLKLKLLAIFSLILAKGVFSLVTHPVEICLLVSKLPSPAIAVTSFFSIACF